MARKLLFEKLECRRVLATFVVNTNVDDGGTGSCLAGPCSLRSAINAANATTALDIINFSIPGNGVLDIRPPVALPSLSHAAVIDATSQPGYVGVPRIVLDGSAIVDKTGSFESGLMLRGGGSEVRGLSIVSFPDYGIWIDGPGNTVVAANFIGLRPDQSTPGGNGRGDGSAATIRDGIGIINSPSNLIGGLGTERNIISGNIGAGVLIWGQASRFNIIENNFVGLDVGGSIDIGNGRGISIRNMANQNIVKTNVVSGNSLEGVLIDGSGVTANRIMNNKIGTSPDGKAAISNKTHGVWIGSGATDNVIGGPNLKDGNLISGNARSGIIVVRAGTDRNELLNNTVGLNIDGLSLPNRIHGVHLFDGPKNNQVGNTGAGNTISGNLLDGVVLEGAETSGNIVVSNRIGTDVSRTEQRSNGRNGMTLLNGTHSNQIGGIEDGMGNTIAYNLLGAIRLDRRENEATLLPGNQNAIRGNSVFLNATQAIDLGTHGLDTNDMLDSDTGPNDLQNRPELLSAFTSATKTVIRGSLNSKANGVYDVDLFFSSAPSGIGDAQTYLGTHTLVTTVDGSADFSVDFAQMLPLGSTITATATDLSGNTSELSLPVYVEGSEGKPRVTILNRSSLEGDAGLTNIDFEVRLSSPALQIITVPFTVVHGSTTASDFVATEGFVTFPVGSKFSYASVGIVSDLIDETDEDFTVRLSPTNSVDIPSADARGIIFDDDSTNSRPFGAASRDLATYMLGKVKVAVIVLDSDGSVDTEVERWTPAQADAVKRSIRLGYDWWEETVRRRTNKHELSFDLDFTFVDNPVPIPYEPLSRSVEEVNLWIESFLAFASANKTGNFPRDFSNFFDTRRIEAGVDWYFPLFVTLTSNDSDRSYLGRTSPNNYGASDRWVLPQNDYLVSDNGATTIHESAHVFYALDEYNYVNADGTPLSHTYTNVSGYYATQNTNAFHGNPSPLTRIPSVMSEESADAYKNFTSSPQSLAMIGWQDSDGNGVFDVLDQPLTLEMTAIYDAASNLYQLNGTSSVTTLDNKLGVNRNDISINRIRRLEARIDGGEWRVLQTFDSAIATINVATKVFSGEKLELRTVSQIDEVQSPLLSFTAPGLPRVVPVISWENPPNIVFGDSLTAMQLNAAADVAGVFSYTPSLGSKLNAGSNQQLSVVFTPTDSTRYKTAEAKVFITVDKATPTVAWPIPAGVVFGTTLSTSQLNATSAIAGTFAYTPAIGTKLSAGSAQDLSVNFTPTDTANFNSFTTKVKINVAKADPVVNWTNPADITFEALLSATQLNATSATAGTFSYTPSIGTKLSAGSAQELSGTFTPTDSANFNTVTTKVKINVVKADPVVNWTNPANITFGTLLSATQLSATSATAGTFAYTPAIAMTLSAGSAQDLSVTFTPTDTVNFNTVTTKVKINVAKADPVVNWTNPTNITFGTLLSATHLNATSATAGTFAYTPAIGTKLSAGSSQDLSVTFTPTDAANFNTVTTKVKINVAKADPVVNWANPANITFGTLLSATQLNATSSTAGTFAYTPAIGTKLSAGSAQDLSVTFTPTDTANFNTITTKVKLNVTKVDPVVTWANPADITFSDLLSATQLNATSGTDGEFVYTPAIGTKLNVGPAQVLSVTFTPTDTANINTITSTVKISVKTPSQDFGDAPAPYPVALANDGARHTTGALILGSTIDAEADAASSQGADIDGASDDGIFVHTTFISTTVATTSSFSVIASGLGKLDAWIDFNRDGDWLDGGEQIFTSASVVAGNNLLSFIVPANATSGSTGARFRLSTAGGLAPTGAATDGEVEDYPAAVVTGSATEALRIEVPSGNTSVVVEGDSLVVQKGATVIAKVPFASFGSLKLNGSSLDDILLLTILESLATKTLEFDGGLGKDFLTLAEAGKTLDLTDAKVTLRDIEGIDITGTGNNKLVISVDKVKTASTTTDTLEVVADDGDTIVFGTGFKIETPMFIDGQFTHVITENARGGTAVAKVLLRNDRFLTNPLTPFDADRDGKIVPLDALRIINELRRRGSGAFLLPTRDSEISKLYFDVNSDGRLTALDALRIINAIARNLRGGVGGSGEGEAVATPTPAATPVDMNQFRNSPPAQRETTDVPISQIVLTPVSRMQATPNFKESSIGTIDDVMAEYRTNDTLEQSSDLLLLSAKQ